MKELLEKTIVYDFNGRDTTVTKAALPDPDLIPVSMEEIRALPENLRPQLTGSLRKVEFKEPSYLIILDNYSRYLKEKNPKKKELWYHMFRQGLDILDLDSITYEIIGTNPCSMGFWLPPLIEAAKKQDFFKIPATKVIKVPLTLLQLTRVEYTELTPTTLAIVDRFCQQAFQLDEEKEYFVKTGTYSSKFDFRNAYVHGAKEVRELGEYLLFIHYQACQMASPLCQPVIYGVSTTNEWVVRDFIPDVENNPSIYKGLPLHTEYRLFIDIDEKSVLGMNPYWDPDLMKQRFGHREDADSPHQIHDYVIYQMHEDVLMKRYKENEKMVREKIEEMLPHISLAGQWSIDVMQNGNDFWIIDMAPAQESALKECVPKGSLKLAEENWIPDLKKTLEEKECK